MISDQTRRLARFHLDVAHALYRARERAGLSLETVAERTGLTPERVVMIEEGDTSSLTEVAQLCEAIGVGVAQVVPQPEEQTRPDRHDLRVAPRALRTG